jgi:AcrR family transcriptional regulator
MSARSPADSPRSPRERPARAPLSREAVIEAGLNVLKAEGLDAVTMRRVAAELDTGAASLYVYVANRDELLDLMLDRVVSTLPIEPLDPARWREQVKDLLRAEVTVMDAYPGIARVALGRIPTGEQAMGAADALLAYLRAGGVPDLSAAWAADLLHLYTTAMAMENSIQAAAGLDEAGMADYVAGVRARFEAVSPDRFPNMAALMPMLFQGTAQERFEFGLDLLINGLLTTPPPTPAPDPA